MRRIVVIPRHFHCLRLFSIPFTKFEGEPKFRVHLSQSIASLAPFSLSMGARGTWDRV